MSEKEDRVREQLQESAELKRRLSAECTEAIVRVAESIAAAVKAGGKVLICGNGGSAADSQHFAAEMIGRLRRERSSIPAIALTTDTSILTAVGNDFGFERIFVRQVEGLGKSGDVLVGISTSGSSANVKLALERGRALGMTTVGLLGADGGTIAAECDHSILVPAEGSQRIQEAHITIVHILCDLVESDLFF